MATIQKRGDSYRVLARHKGCKPQTRTFERRSDAVKWGRATEDRMRLGEFRGDTKITVAKLFKRYADEVSPGKNGTRWEQIRLTLFIRTALFVYKSLDRISDQDIKSWRDKRVKEVKGSTVNRELNLMSAVFKHASSEWGIKIANPIKGVKRPKPGAARNRRISQVEIEQVWKGVGGEKLPPAGYGATLGYVPWIMEFGVETAMRLGEMCALRWDQVNLEEGWVLVAKSKNGDSRYVPLTLRARVILETLGTHDNRVFPVNAASAGSTFYKLVRRVGISGLTMHDTRHEGTTRLASKLSILELAKVVGHRDPKSLMTYYNPTGRELAEKLTGLRGGGVEPPTCGL